METKDNKKVESSNDFYTLLSNVNLANKKIALFDGYRESGKNIIHEEYGTLTEKGLSLLRYNLDWNWLMRIVEKINKCDWVTIRADDCEIHALRTKQFENIKVEKEGGELIEIVYEAVLRYVVWYLDNIT